MGTLQKFKVLATQCTIPNSPTRSPTTSPIIHLRRRKTLRMFLTRTATHDVCNNKDESPDKTSNKNKNNNNSKLKDLFVSSSSTSSPSSSPPRSSGDALGWRGGGGRAVRPWSVALRQRLLRKHWRPLLVTIHE